MMGAGSVANAVVVVAANIYRRKEEVRMEIFFFARGGHIRCGGGGLSTERYRESPLPISTSFICYVSTMKCNFVIFALTFLILWFFHLFAHGLFLPLTFLILSFCHLLFMTTHVFARDPICQFNYEG